MLRRLQENKMERSSQNGSEPVEDSITNPNTINPTKMAILTSVSIYPDRYGSSLSSIGNIVDHLFLTRKLGESAQDSDY